MSEQTIQLREAFCFTCPKCGHTNLVHGVVLEDPTEQEAAQKLVYDSILRSSGPDAAERWDGQVMVTPDRVVCSSCNAPYLVESAEMTDFFSDDPAYDPDEEFEDDWDEDSDEWDDDFDDEDDDWEDDEDFDEESAESF